MTALVNDAELVAMATPVAELRGVPVADVIMRHLQPTIDAWEAGKRGPTTENFYRSLMGGTS